MEFALLGWPADGPTLDLDHREFAYAGKFVMSSTGKALAREDGEILGAVSFDSDRTDERAARLRYVTVREDRRGEGIGPRLCAFAADRLRERGFDRVLIAVNNPFAYEALYRAGFGYTGERTGIAEFVLQHPDPDDRSPERYRDGMAAFGERDELPEAHREFVDRKLDGEPPEQIERPERDVSSG